jgi:hypothetical protein
MLLSLEDKAKTQQKASLLLVHYPWSFTRKDSDIQCLGHIINLAVYAALT